MDSAGGTPFEPETPQRRRSGWTIPGLVIGLGVIAVCLMVPQIEENRAVLYDVERLRGEYRRIEMQISINDEFLAKVAVDPTLMSRLAQRQLRLLPGGTDELQLSGIDAEARSPFQLVTVPPAPEMPPYKPFGGDLLGPFREPRTRLYLMGAALFVMGAALILDGPVKRVKKPAPKVPESPSEHDSNMPSPPPAPAATPAGHPVVASAAA